MDNIYRENILDHFNRPRNFGHIHRPDYFHEEENTLCGDRIKMEIKIKKSQPKAGPPLAEKVKINDIKFSGEGCAICMASASMLTEKLKGMDIPKARKFSVKDMLNLLGVNLTPVRLKCALLPLEVLQKILLFVKMK